MESDIWDMPPLYYKVWRYILISADRRTGTLTKSGPQIAEDVQWMENNAVVRPDRKTISRILKYLSGTKSLATVASGSSSRRYYHISICNWSTYQTSKEELATEDPRSLPQNFPPIQEVQLVPGLNGVPTEADVALEVQRSQKATAVDAIARPMKSELQKETAHKTAKEEKLEKLHSQYPEIEIILNTKWLANYALPKSSQTPSARFEIANTIKLLHTADGYSWDEVGRIVEHAAKFWAPKGYMFSPAKLRTKTRSGDSMVHEVIMKQLLLLKPTQKKIVSDWTPSSPFDVPPSK